LDRNQKLQDSGVTESKHFLLKLLDEEIFINSLDYSEQILKLVDSFYEVLPCKEKNDEIRNKVKNRVEYLEKEGRGDEKFSMLVAKLV